MNRTTPYHPAANGMVERFHCTLNAALMARPKHTWLQLFPSVLLGLRVSVKEDLGASAAEMIYGINLRLPGEFFEHNTQSTSSTPPNQSNFLNKFREYLREVLPTPAAHHSNRPIFIHKELNNCSHVFLRSDHIRKPLEPPYTGPCKVLNKISERLFTIEVGDKKLNVSIERLKPAFLENTDVPAEPKFLEILVDNPRPKHDTALVRSTKKKVTFAEDPLQLNNSPLQSDAIDKKKVTLTRSLHHSPSAIF
ncbi:uncharacterized protein LOC119666063 [Teleopsis dalmanni]|uniref:uncharacterized protein LOC119666063 n=1 Tax=Teleopsis dalmanni TaxID=139649 RepID=UPI0018CDF52B|nr:uncharacterized protein LOC119666063 [Teleopsis dalmanni]